MGMGDDRRIDVNNRFAGKRQDQRVTQLRGRCPEIPARRPIRQHRVNQELFPAYSII
jgi:hypothetical protein